MTLEPDRIIAVIDRGESPSNRESSNNYIGVMEINSLSSIWSTVPETVSIIRTGPFPQRPTAAEIPGSESVADTLDLRYSSQLTQERCICTNAANHTA